MKLVRKTEDLLKFRLFVYFVAYAHLVIMCIRLLGKDFHSSEDVSVRVYATYKWKLITTWFNLISSIYIPLCMYCDWRELKCGEVTHVKLFNKIRNFTFTNLLLPTTAFADILFWRLYYHDKYLLMPVAVEDVIHLWEHHSMHTASLAFVVFDLLFVRRERPMRTWPGIIVMLSFVSMYTAVCLQSVLNEEYLYPLFKKLPPHKLLVLTVYTYISFLFYHAGQWLLIELIHGQRTKLKKNVE